MHIDKRSAFSLHCGIYKRNAAFTPTPLPEGEGLTTTRAQSGRGACQIRQKANTIRRLRWPDGHVQRIARAVKLLRRDYTRALPVEALATEAGMSASAFHRHFKSITSLSPLQFQKRLRLIEARRLMQSQGMAASSAAYAVGYESVPQFTREYGRMFGRPPVADARAAVA